VQCRGAGYPAREEFFTAAPAVVEAKARYGMPWFDAKWSGTVAAARAAKAAKAPVKATTTSPAKGTRTSQDSGLGGPAGGATQAQITVATGWQAHSVRGFMANAGLRSGKNAAGAL
jgi:hypothetical protein